jgi:glycosyltransferase involved in cell wall biosynthesis
VRSEKAWGVRIDSDGEGETRPVKVTLVEFSPSGGLFQFALQLGEALARGGHRVELVTGRNPEFLPAARNMRLAPILPTWHPGAAGLESRLLRKARRPVRAALHLDAWRRLSGHLARTRPDVVQWSAWRFAVDGWMVSRLASRPDAPVMIDVAHAPEPMVPRGAPGSLATRPLLRQALTGAFRRMDAVFVLGERSRSQLLEAWPGVRRVEAIPHGDEGLFRRADIHTPDQPSPGQTPPRILLFGTLTGYKGLDLLLDAFARVRADMPEAQLVVAGAVSADLDFPAVARQASALGGVTLLPGYVPHHRVAELFGGACVVVVPYRQANQSGVVHLAHTFGRPVVATAVGDLPEVVLHEETGLVVPPDDPAGLAAALLRLLRQPREAARLGRAGERRLALRASWPEIAARVATVYRELLDGRRGTTDRLSAPEARGSSGNAATHRDGRRDRDT